MIRNYDELMEYMTVQGLIVREPREGDGALAMNCTPEGAQVCYLLLALIGGEDKLIGERKAKRMEELFAAQVDDEVEIEIFVSPLQELITMMIAVLGQHPRFGDAITAALERR